MSERRFVLVDFTHMSSTRCLTVYEAGETYTMPRAVAHAAAKRGLVAKQRPSDGTPPSIVRSPEALTEADVFEAEKELGALQRHALEVINPDAGSVQAQAIRFPQPRAFHPRCGRCARPPACTYAGVLDRPAS